MYLYLESYNSKIGRTLLAMHAKNKSITILAKAKA